ncbi:hypothetical protein GMMP15_440009 [Candidatus Magnetomoraceae bacterium gMMP-15]
MKNPQKSFENYFKSEDFLHFQDKILRENAYKAAERFIAERFIHDYKPVKNGQLHSISVIIQGSNLSGLKDLIENQKKKNTKEINKQFWEFIHKLIFDIPGSSFSLRSILKTELENQKLLQDETGVSEEKLKLKQVRKNNKRLIDEFLNRVLLIYFEHFNNHYFYKTKMSEDRK